MSSCCLAACGRLAENSQSGEAALTLCGRALLAHLHAAGQGGGSALGNSVLCPFPQLSPDQGAQGEPPAHPVLSQCCSTHPSLSIPTFSLDQRFLVCSPFPSPWTCTEFPALPQAEVMLVGAAGVCRGFWLLPCHSQVSFPCCAFGSPGMAPEVRGAQSCGWQLWEKDLFPRICCGCSCNEGSQSSSGSAPEQGMSCKSSVHPGQSQSCWSPPSISLPWIRALHLTEEASQGFRWEDKNS